jgi:hypothetical protein
MENSNEYKLERAMRKLEDIRTLLEQKFRKEKLRLESHGEKASSYDLANATVRFVQSLMSESRNSELKRLVKKIPELSKKSYYQERLKATAMMAKVIQDFAEKQESKKSWKYKPKHKHKHRSKI